jgi:DegV family protein with EDD domain
MSSVTILTDSSAYLPVDLVAKYPIKVIPLTLNWDGETYRDGIDIKAAEFYKRLSASCSIPTTSQISAGELITNVKELLTANQDVLLLLISSGISSTYQTAVSSLKNFPDEKVTLLDTKLVSMALGFQVLTAARAAVAGASLSECKLAAQQAYDHIGVYFIVNTLKYLAAGGRINSAKRLLGSALNIKPILAIQNGKIELVRNEISQSKAIRKMLDMIEMDIDNHTPVRISVFHALADKTAEELMETAQKRFSPIEIILSEVSPVVGAHVGPGTIAVAYQAGE